MLHGLGGKEVARHKRHAGGAGRSLVRAFKKSRNWGDRRPCRKRFRRDQALPRAVHGPVDFWALRRLAANRAGVKVGDLRRDMARPPIQSPTIYHYDTVVNSKDYG
jgi:hypothetical protein